MPGNVVKKNVLFIENTSDLIGGGQQSLLNLLRFLDRDRFSPMVVFPCDGPFAERILTLGIPVFFSDMNTLKTLNVLRLAQSVRSLIRILRSRKIDLVHTNASRTTWYAGLACRMAGVSLVWHVRIAMRESFYDALLYLLSDRVIAISNAVARRFPYPNSRKKVSVIYNGIDPDEFHLVDASPFRRRFKLDDKFVIGVVGQINPLKGQVYVIRALKQLSASFPHLHCLIVGSPTAYQRELERMVTDLGLETSVTFTGWQQDVREVMSALDILAVPSHTEGFGRVLIEAMACERPVVAFAVDAVPEIIESGESGLLVPKGDLAGLVTAIRALIENRDLRQRIARNGKERVRRLFDIRENVRRTQQVYDLCKV